MFEFYIIYGMRLLGLQHENIVLEDKKIPLELQYWYTVLGKRISLPLELQHGYTVLVGGIPLELQHWYIVLGERIVFTPRAATCVYSSRRRHTPRTATFVYSSRCKNNFYP